MTKFIDENENYWIADRIQMCCDEAQFVYLCKKCDETMDCYYCGFNYEEAHDCDIVKP